MRKHIALLTTVAALAVTPALAQSTQQQDKQPAPQAQPSQPSQAPSTSSPSTTTQAPADKSMESKSMTDKPAAAGEKFVDVQTSGQWLASDVMGMNVAGSNNDSIGSVSDLLIDDEGNILAAVVGVGGFLGIGQKNVAISFESFTISTDKDGNPEARLSLTKEELESAPEFKTAAAVKAESERPSSPATGSKPATPRN